MMSRLFQVARISSVSLLTLLMSLGVNGAAAAATPTYDLIAIECPDGYPWTYGRAINERGDVTGDCIKGDVSEVRPFLYRGGSVRDLGNPAGYEFSFAADLNNRGTVVGGVMSAADFSTTRAVEYKAGEVTVLDVADESSSFATGVNDSGMVVGYYAIGGVWRPFALDKGRIEDLGSLGGTYGTADAVNNRGQITGSSQTSTGNYHAFLCDDGDMIDITADPGVINGSGVDINDRAQVTGYVIRGPQHQRAFLWDAGDFSEVPTLGGNYAYGYGINDSGDMVGGSTLQGDGTTHAFFYRAGVIEDLNDLVDPASELREFVTLDTAVDIANNGVILVIGTDSRTGALGTYLMMPRSVGK